MTTATTLPPSPKLPKILQTYLIFGQTVPFLRWARRRCGETFSVYGAPMGWLVYVSDPEVIREVFAGDPAVFRPGEGNMVLGDVLGARSVLTLDEDEHLEMRKLLLPPFHGRSVQRYEELIESIAAAEVERWPVGKSVKLHPRMQALTLEVILRAVLGVDDPARLDALRPRLRRLAHLDSVLTLMWVWKKLDRVGPWRRYRKLQAEVDDLLLDEIRRRRDAADLAERTDILSLLVAARRADGSALTDKELRDQCVTLLLAGHETTATGLAWAFERLMRSPATTRRLRTEIAAGEGTEYLDAVVKETLRVRPVIADVARKLARPARVAGYDLPAGVTVMPAISLVQADEHHHPGAGDFSPERWLDGGAGSPPYTWIPFGGGRRRCLGVALANLEMKTVLRTVLERVDLRAPRPADEKVRAFHITQIPARGAEAVVTRRPVTERPAAPAVAGAAPASA
ncbi:MAG: cytochrome family [Thermoleophilaceae bacterium]|nr:cytochrome family [Thermoleophilaceae bacterium]